MEDFAPVLAIVTLFLGLPWLIFHYITKWKTASTLTYDDEALLQELYGLAKRLDERMDTVERLVGSDHPEFKPARLLADNAEDNAKLDEIEQLLTRSKKRTAK